MPLLIFAQQAAETGQTQYTLAYALIFTILFLGFLVVCIPRPRKTFYPSEKAEQDAKKEAELKKLKAKKKREKDKRNKKRAKGKKKKKAAKR